MNPPGTPRLTGAVGIATYQRPDILLACLEHLSRQTRLPEEILIADASPPGHDTEARIRRALPELVAKTRLVYLSSEPGTSLQRNRILDQLRSDVVLFLDDDTLVAPEYVERILAVFEADVEQQVAGVEGQVTEGSAGFTLPGSAPASPAPAPRRSLRQAVGLVTRLGRRVLEGTLDRFALPYYPETVSRPGHEVPARLRHLPVEPIRTLYGCAMSARAPLAREVRFNENLRRYGFMEDFEFSYRLGKRHALLRCSNAPARHLRFQGGRLHPSLVRYLSLINVAYIGRTALEWTPELSRHIERHARRDAQLERIRGCFRKTGFSHHRAATAGLRQVLRILAAPEEEVVAVYRAAAEEGFARGSF